MVESKYLRPEEILTGAKDTGLVATGEGMEYPLPRLEVEINGKVVMVNVG